MNNQEQPNLVVQCPVCFKEFSTFSIEIHVSKCLFLNDSTDTKKGGSAKRTLNADSPSSKKPKNDSSSIVDTKAYSLSPIVPKVQSDNVEQAEQSKSGSSFRIMRFGNNIKEKSNESVPLAEKMRPTNLLSYIGQTHVMGPQSMLYQLLSKTEIPNIILWGPPGCGKTSLANVIANICKNCPRGKYRFVKLSAAMSGVNDVKEAITIASNELKFGRCTVIFMDEIHRFNKTQQDIFLPHVESGTITLIGATTENPSFSLNSALLSRCRVIVLEKLSIEELIMILENAVKTSNGSIYDTNDNLQSSKNSNNKFFIDKDTIKWLAETSDGDARIALGGLELAIQSKVSKDNELSEKLNVVSLDDVKDGLKKTHMLYDRKGDQHYDMISALHKSVRASDDNASLYWLTRMMAGGEDPVYIARRLVRMASEDIGLADPKALGVAINTMQACKLLGMPDCDVLLAQCTTYLARAPKSRLMEDSLRAAQRLVGTFKGAQPSVPIHLRNAPTKLMKNLGYGKGYNMKHKDESGLTYLPEEIDSVDFFDST